MFGVMTRTRRPFQLVKASLLSLALTQSRLCGRSAGENSVLVVRYIAKEQCDVGIGMVHSIECLRLREKVKH